MEVHIAYVSHRHGGDFYVARSEIALTNELLEYVTEWWNEACGDTPMPSIASEAIEMYFENSPDEWMQREKRDI